MAAAKIDLVRSSAFPFHNDPYGTTTILLRPSERYRTVAWLGPLLLAGMATWNTVTSRRPILFVPCFAIALTYLVYVVPFLLRWANPDRVVISGPSLRAGMRTGYYFGWTNETAPLATTFWIDVRHQRTPYTKGKSAFYVLMAAAEPNLDVPLAWRDNREDAREVKRLLERLRDAELSSRTE